jgi:bacterioferritin (cytochrome b1)
VAECFEAFGHIGFFCFRCFGISPTTRGEAIHLSDEASDAATRELLESIVKEEDAHVDWLEAQLDQIVQLGVPMYLSTQTRD